MSLQDRPAIINDKELRYDSFRNGNVVFNKKKNHLPAMGWNSWNAFGSGNTEALSKEMADSIVRLGLDKLGYEYVILDDGCYKPERVDGLLANEEVKFPSGFRALADYIHGKGLKFGMYNDIGTNLCAGAAVGTCGHELDDAQTYINWGVDFIKVDNCYYLWDNATFSDAKNARYTYAPRIKSISVKSRGEGTDFSAKYSAVDDGVLTGRGAVKTEEYVENIGTFDGTGPENTPVGEQGGELRFNIEVPVSGEYELIISYSAGQEVGCGEWLQVACGEEVYFDDIIKPSLIAKDTNETGIITAPGVFVDSMPIVIRLASGENEIRLMNHRRQENTLSSYAALQEGFDKYAPDGDIILSICEWGKTQPQNWGYKVGDSWRILNDITFQVGSDGDPGKGSWIADYTTSVTTQYSKAVIMDEYAGLDKGWNDPDMLMIGMNGLDETMCKTHMTMWSMMNSPLMLGLDLRRVEKGDRIWNIIANKDIIALNQDALGVQAKRIYTTAETKDPATDYIRDMDRVDILAKPLSDGSIALSFINVSDKDKNGCFMVDKSTILDMIGSKMTDREAFENASGFKLVDLWTGESSESGDSFAVDKLMACDNVTVKVIPVI